jgi:hypothetical protein
LKLYQANKMTADSFYGEVSKKLGISKDVVKDIYMKYLSRVQEVARKEVKVMVRGLGTFEVHPNKAFARLYAIDRIISYKDDIYSKDVLPSWAYEKIEMGVKIIKHLEKLKHKYEFIEKSMEDFWTNQRGINKYVDHQGNYRRDFKKETGDLQCLPQEKR